MTMRWMTLICLTLANLAAAAPTIDDEQALRMDYVTPHTAWAKPYAGGNTRVLFIGDYHATGGREIIELMQRFDITAEAAYYGRIVDTTNDEWHGGDAGLERIRQLVAQPWDVYLFSKVALSLLPAEIQYKILEPVSRGAGLVFLGKKDDRLLKTKLPAVPGGPDAELFQIKAGRAAVLPAPPVIPYRFGWDTEYDVWQSRLGRTILWAAGKLAAEQPAIAVPETIARETWPSRLARVQQAGQQPRWRLRRLEDGRVAEADDPGMAADRTPGEVILGSAPLPAGHWLVEVWGGQPAIDRWAIAPFEVTSQRQVALEVPKAWGEIGETLAGTATLTGQALANEQVSVEVRDRHGRLLARTTPAAPAGETVPFEFTIEPWYPMLVQLRAVVSDAAGEATEATVYANVTKRQRGKFNFLVWDIPSGPAAYYAEAKLADLGMTLQLGGQEPPPRQLAAYNVSYVPYTVHINNEKDAQGFAKPVPWTQEPEVDAWVDQVVQKRVGARQHGTFVYSLGDEIATRGSDVSPSDLAAYQAWLKGQYTDIARLNAAWGTTYANFGEIALLDANEPQELAAKQAGNYPRWYDRQAWESANFIQLCERFVKRFSELDPEALVGFEGAGRFDRGDDIDGIVRTNGFWSPYPGPIDFVIEGIAPREFPRANWMGYFKDGPPLIWKYWRMLLNGTDAVWWWRWDGIGRFNGVLRPDLSESDGFKDLWADTRITREGLGDLLLRSERQHDGVAILYSHPSVYATQVADGPSYGNYEGAHLAWQKQLGNAGLNFRYLTDGQLRRGEFDPNSAQVVILSRAEALGDTEAAALREFVQLGGVLIADVRPGLYDDHLVRRTTGALDDVFGIETTSSTAAAKGQEAELSFDKPAGNRRPEMMKAEKQIVDPGLKLAGATALGQAGETPLLIEHAYGQGRAVLLNLAVEQADSFSAGMPGAFAGRLLAAAGVTPAIALERQPAPGVLPDLRLVRWMNGGDTIVAVQSQATSGPAIPVRLRWPDRQSVTEVRTGRDLGSVNRLDLSLDPGSAQILALTGGQGSELKLALGQPAVAPGERGQLTITAPGARGDRAALVTATRPDGTPADWLRQVVTIPAGSAGTVDLPMALNDPAGAWTLNVKELYRQRTTTVTLSVR